MRHPTEVAYAIKPDAPFQFHCGSYPYLVSFFNCGVLLGPDEDVDADASQVLGEVMLKLCLDRPESELFKLYGSIRKFALATKKVLGHILNLPCHNYNDEQV